MEETVESVETVCNEPVKVETVCNEPVKDAVESMETAILMLLGIVHIGV